MELREPTIEGRDVPAVRAELEILRKAHPEKLLVAEQVVERAKNPTNPMHKHFQWDDSEAAHQYRLVQARQLIRYITVVLPDDPKETLLPKYISLASDRTRDGGGYRQTSDILDNEALMAELEATALKDLEAIQNRYHMLTELVAQIRVIVAARKAATAPKKRKK